MVDHETARACGVQQLDLTLVRATNYTDDGYPIRTRIGVIRSNTLTQMGTLAQDLITDPFFSGVSLRVRLIDEAIERVPVNEILRRSRTPGVKTMVMLVGVQTNQFPRAQDIASWFLPHGIPVLLGGFHVSGMLAMVGMTADLRAALSNGIILVAGEVEGERLPTIVKDVLRGEAKPLYNYLHPLPDITDIPLPRLTKRDFRRFASAYGTIESGRGCVFTCDFCTIINVQGRTMRHRNPQQVIEFVRQSYREAGTTHCFFTDDNLARNPRWRELFEGLARLRENENIPFTFMMQSDLAARRLPGGDFFILAAKAGCRQVFFGVESVNRDNLRSQEKFQNQVSQYSDLVAHCRSVGITCHAGYILGLPFDTPISLQQDIAELQRIGFDSASFYILTPLPGSKDHQRWWRERRWMDKDFNNYDSAHVAVAPERMTNEELKDAYHAAWDQFYSTAHMVAVLKQWRHHWKRYWDRMFFFAAYLYASRVERLHPMNCGFWTVRKRTDRRPGFPREAFIPFWWNRFTTTVFRLREIGKLFFHLEEVWLRSRQKSAIEEALEESIQKTRQGIADWRDLKARELVQLYQKLHDQMPEVTVPSVVSLWLKKRNPFVHAYTRAYVQRIWRQWYLHVWNPLRWAEVWLFECVTGLRFLTHLLVAGR
ncbi:MAG TPA: radical SAM protein [Bacteroidota bacterium]